MIVSQPRQQQHLLRMLTGSLQAPLGCVGAEPHLHLGLSAVPATGEGEAPLLSASSCFSPEEPKHPFPAKRTLLRSLSQNCFWLLLLGFGSAFPSFLIRVMHFRTVFTPVSCLLLYISIHIYMDFNFVLCCALVSYVDIFEVLLICEGVFF